MHRIKQLLQRYRDVLYMLLFLVAYCAIAMLLSLPCPIRWLTGVSCPGCGITRASVALCRLDFRQAVYYNPSVFIVIAAVLLVIVFRNSRKAKKWIVGTAAVMMVLVYICRMAIFKTPVLQFDPASGAIPRFFRWICNNFTQG